MYSDEEFVAAHHEASHAVVAVVLGLPIQDKGIHIDTHGKGICFNLHRRPGDLNNSSIDVEERERSIKVIKAGYIANCKLFPGYPAIVAEDDRTEEIELLSEGYAAGSTLWNETDRRLSEESEHLVNIHWNAIVAVAAELLAKSIRPRTNESLQRWKSTDTHARSMSGQEISDVLKRFQLVAIVRSESEGTYYDPNLY